VGAWLGGVLMAGKGRGVRAVVGLARCRVRAARSPVVKAAPLGCGLAGSSLVIGRPASGREPFSWRRVTMDNDVRTRAGVAEHWHASERGVVNQQASLQLRDGGAIVSF
jgi:hypothetical protein